MKTFLCVLALLLGTAVVQAAPVAEPVAAPVVAEPLAENGLKVSISAAHYCPDNADEKISPLTLWLPYSDSKVLVVLQNTSDKPINFRGSRSFDSVDSLRLEITNINDQDLAVPIIEKPRYRTKWSQVSYSNTILPGEVLVEEILLPMKEIMKGLPAYTKDGRRTITLRAVFSDDGKHDFADVGHHPTPSWSGYSSSPVLTYDFIAFDNNIG